MELNPGYLLKSFLLYKCSKNLKILPGKNAPSEKYHHTLEHVLKWLYIIQMMHIKFPKWQDNSCTVIHGGRTNNVIFQKRGLFPQWGQMYFEIAFKFQYIS